MNLVVVSHKVCWPSPDSLTGYATDGGFPVQMRAISELFSSTELVLPCRTADGAAGGTPVEGSNMRVRPLSIPKGTGLRRKVNMLFWVIKEGPVIWRSIRRSDAVHAPIPGDVGTVGMVFALILKKPLFVRHCGNWLSPKTTAERFWKWSMEYFAGGRNVMLATGGAMEPPSARNANVQWIFSTSLRRNQMLDGKPRRLPADGKLRMVIACRQELRKGTDVVIASMPLLLKTFPNASLDVVGDGSLLEKFKEQTRFLGIDDCVTFHGKVEQAKVLQILKQAHLFCYPTSASEGFPKAVLEALAGGLPVATTKVSVLPQLLKSGCGVLLSEPTARVLADAVTEICLDESKYTRMSSMALETSQEYSLEKWRDVIGQTLCEAWKVSSLSLMRS